MKVRWANRLLPAAVLLAALILGACGATANPPASNPTTAPAAAQPTTAPATAATAAPTAAPAAPTAAPAAPTAAPAATGSLPAIITMPEQIAGGRPVNITVIGKPPESSPSR